MHVLQHELTAIREACIKVSFAKLFPSHIHVLNISLNPTTSRGLLSLWFKSVTTQDFSVLTRRNKVERVGTFPLEQLWILGSLTLQSLTFTSVLIKVCVDAGKN